MGGSISTRGIFSFYPKRPGVTFGYFFFAMRQRNANVVLMIVASLTLTATLCVYSGMKLSHDLQGFLVFLGCIVHLLLVGNLCALPSTDD